MCPTPSIRTDSTFGSHAYSGLAMKTRHRLLCFFAAASLAVGASASAARADCETLLAKFNAAIDGRNVLSAKDLEAQIAVDANCGGRLIEVQQRRAALQLLLAQQLIDKHAATADYEMLLVDADKPDVLWRAAVGLGDIRLSQRRFGDAAVAYDRAIETIKNKSKTPTSPGEPTIKAILDRATESKMLAANDGVAGSVFVPAAKDHRDGTIGGTMSQDIRGFKPTSIPIPIRFETASAKFTPVGEQAAKELLDTLREQAPAELTLVGHTDERGEADYNMRLSDQRVKAVAAFLKQNGITAKVATIAKGKSEPLQLPDTSELSREDIWALNRRVVWKRN
jgi:outer membrane protein OmpA-like peptidoglycan-associated protein